MFQASIWIRNASLRIVGSKEKGARRIFIKHSVSLIKNIMINKKLPTPNPLRHTILLGLTTTPGSDWREKIKEIDRFGTKEIALFPTYLQHKDRQELYDRLEKTGLETIVFTHLREEDMKPEEINYLIERYHCKLFNIHPYRFGTLPPECLDQFRDKIYIENAGPIDKLEEIAEKYAGLCVDFAHFEAGNIMGENDYKNFEKMIEKFKVGFAHISAVREEPVFVSWDKEHKPHYDLHTLDDLNQLDYLKKYKEYLPEILGIELENSFDEQIKIKAYLEKMINE